MSDRSDKTPDCQCGHPHAAHFYASGSCGADITVLRFDPDNLSDEPNGWDSWPCPCLKWQPKGEK